MAHVPALDGLRGAAVAAVLLYHAGHLDGGYLGVDLFFVLSGFLITALLLGEQEGRGRISLRQFWVRRARRLLPAVLVLLAGIAAYAQVLARPVDLDQLRGDGLATLFYVANWRTILHGSSYWDLSLSPSPLQHTWSLAIEEQFYLLWPLAVAAVARWRGGDVRRTVGRIALAGAAASAALFVGLHHLGARDTRLYEGTDTRAAALLLGVALAAHRGWVDRLPVRAREGAGVVAAGVLGAMWVLLEGESRWLYRGGLPLASALAVVVIAAASSGSSPVLGRVLSISPLRALGLISYGLYLWHWPVYVVLDQRNGRYPLFGDLRLDGAALLVVKLALSVVAALVSYWVVEQPIRRGALPGWRGGAAALGGTAVAGVLVVASTTGAATVAGQSGPVGQASVVVEGPTVLVVGDSVALSVVTPIVRDPRVYGVNPINAARIGCTVLAEDHEMVNFAGQPIDLASCFDEPRVEGRPDPDAVFLYLGARPNDYITVEGRHIRACDPGYDRILRAEVAELLRSLAPGGRPSVVATIPRSGEHSIPVEGAEERIVCANDVLRQVVDDVPGAHLLDMDALVCPDPGPCREELEGHPIRSDGVHYDDGPGGRLVTEWVLDRVLELTGLRPWHRPG